MPTLLCSAISSTAMTSAILRKNITFSHVLRRQLTMQSMVNHFTQHLHHRIHQTPATRRYFRLGDYVKKTKCEVFPSVSSSLSCSSSSTKVATIFKVGFVGWYLSMLKCRPILTKSITSALIYTAADLTSQAITRPLSEAYDLARTLRMASYGIFILGPSLHFWFNFISKLFPRTDLPSTLKKMVMGQTLYGPFMTVVFLSMNARMQGESNAEITARLKRDLLPTLFNGAMYWPICDFITFKFIPVHLQPLVSNSFSYLWTIYMTYMAGLEKATAT